MKKRWPFLLLIIFPLILLGTGFFFCTDLSKQQAKINKEDPQLEKITFTVRIPPPFCFSKISSTITPRKEWNVPFPSAEEMLYLKKIFSQPFTYLKGGAQAYSFVSKDGQTVIKFFRGKHLTPKKWLKFVPLPPPLQKYRYKKVGKRKERLEKIFGNYKTAYEELKEEGGILFVHLNPSQLFSEPLQLIDRLGNKHLLDLNKTPFILQKRVELLVNRIARLKRSNDTHGIEQTCQSILKLFSTCCQKRFLDLDAGISQNYGFVQDQAIQIDFGRSEKIPLDQDLDIEKELKILEDRLESLVDKL